MSCRVHQARFFAPPSRSAHCLALNREINSLALSRNDASIEIWNIHGYPTMLRAIPGVHSGSVEALCWVDDRLLSTGLSGAIVEWDLKTLSPKKSVLVNGHAAWCLDVTKKSKKLAVGTEQGYINIFSVSNDDIVYEKIFDKQEGRILCCKFDPSEDMLVTGSIETIRVWNVSSGQALHRMTTGRIEKNRETIIWCLEVTRDMTIISGDSRGFLTFWDGNLGEQIEQINTHKADVLSICLCEDKSSLYCSGVDPLIINYTTVKVKQKGHDIDIEKWVKNIQRNIHQHDVRAMVNFENKLFSVGVDGYLCMSSYPPKVLVKYPPIDPYTSMCFCGTKKVVCLRYTNCIELWQLGSALIDEKNHYSQVDNTMSPEHTEETLNTDNKNIGEKETCDEDIEGKSGQMLKVVKGPKLILRLNSSVNFPIVCHAISKNTKWIAYSTENRLRIFKFTMVNNLPALSRLMPLPEECGPCYRIAFSPDSNSLITGTADAHVKIIHIHDDGAITVGNITGIQKVLKDLTLTHLYTYETDDKSGFYLIAADMASNIGIWEINYKEKKSAPRFIASVPHYEYPVSAITINKKERNIVVAYTDHMLIEYNFKSLRMTKWSEKFSNNLGSRWFPITGLAVHPTNPKILMAYDDCGIYVINKNKQYPEEQTSKKPKKDVVDKHSKIFYTVKKCKHLIGAEWILDDNGEVEVALIIVDPATLLEKLPPAFVKRRFGCM